MTRHATTDLAEQFCAAINWWREAGVDLAYADTPTCWLSDAAPVVAKEPLGEVANVRAKPVPPPPPEALHIGGEPENWPPSLEQFVAWWLAETSLGPARGRIAPCGTSGADLMVLVPLPERDDTEILLSGTSGKMITNMLRAMQVPRDRVYLASILPVYQPNPDWAGLSHRGLGAITLHHIRLVAPRRLLVLGMDILPLLGLEKRRGVQKLPLDGGGLELLGTMAPDILLNNTRARAQVWNMWLEWTKE